MENNMLDIKNLHIWYKTYRGYAKVVNGINFYVRRGEKVGLVGESGCGKTTTMKSILRVLDKDVAYLPNDGEIMFQGKNILKLSENEIQDIRRKKISMISQSPMAALNPVFKIGEQILDIIKYSGQYKSSSKKEMLDAARSAIKSVMISDPDRILNSYPYQLSGGMRQRICIAMSLITERDLLIADEPGTALDVTIQDQIYRLLDDLVKKKDCSLIMVTHSLGVARELVDRIYVMYAGDIVETCKARDLFINPLHPYTEGLLDCIPRLSGGGLSEGIYGYIPDYHNPTPGCRFYPRCKSAKDICANEKPPVIEIEEGHYVSCFKYANEKN
ncbi:ABC transporter ATP-binding protein [Lutispora sp.]|uniref:ABC transporter ATP-binding protein n=1 Tax=Lutispora sp. TaxID=2828727 RepID=UPI002B20B690|nr:ABC transporter ATP-binding protein [Lutispora sp.]MEA4962956.1 ABC transporter ATP-binding protein [Lutispora sp.]